MKLNLITSLLGVFACYNLFGGEATKTTHFLDMCYENKLEEVKALLSENKCLAWGVNKQGLGALYIACKKDAFDVMKYLIDFEPTILYMRTKNRYNVMHLACAENKIDIIKFLLHVNESNLSLFGNAVDILTEKTLSGKTPLSMLSASNLYEILNYINNNIEKFQITIRAKNSTKDTIGLGHVNKLIELFKIKCDPNIPIFEKIGLLSKYTKHLVLSCDWHKLNKWRDIYNIYKGLRRLMRLLVSPEDIAFLVIKIAERLDCSKDEVTNKKVSDLIKLLYLIDKDTAILKLFD